jgi:mannose-6-phosphate isomerase-like protein (cupin superfamily)
VAGTAGISVSLLSQVERGVIDPSLESLRGIAGALDTTPFDLLSDWSNRSGIVREGDGRRVELAPGGGFFEILTAWRDASFEVARWELQPGEATIREPRGHKGEEAMYVLSGAGSAVVDEDVYEVAAGDFVAYDARLPHRIEAKGREPLIALFISCPPF